MSSVFPGVGEGEPVGHGLPGRQRGHGAAEEGVGPGAGEREGDAGQGGGAGRLGWAWMSAESRHPALPTTNLAAACCVCHAARTGRMNHALEWSTEGWHDRSCGSSHKHFFALRVISTVTRCSTSSMRKMLVARLRARHKLCFSSVSQVLTSESSQIRMGFASSELPVSVMRLY